MVCARPHTVCRPCLPLASAPRQATGFRFLPLSKEQEESGFAAGAHTRRRRRGGRHGDGVGPRWAPVGGHGGEWWGEVGWWKQTDGRARARGTPSPRTRLIGDTLLPERNRTTAAINTAAVRPLAVSALRGGWGAGGDRREWWRVDGRRKVDEWGGRCRRAGRDGSPRRAWSTRREGVKTTPHRDSGECGGGDGGGGWVQILVERTCHTSERR